MERAVEQGLESIIQPIAGGGLCEVHRFGLNPTAHAHATKGVGSAVPYRNTG